MMTARKYAAILVSLALAATITFPAQGQTRLPNPVLYLTAIEPYSVGGVEMVRYEYDVANRAEYPAEMFVISPALPPCGTNTRSSRSWVDIFNMLGRRLYGFCALGSPQDLGKIWFALPAYEVPPSWVYIEITDRKANVKYKSNLADTVQ